MLPGRKAYWGSLELHHYPDASAVVRALSPDEPVILNRPHAAARAARFFVEKFPGTSLYAVKANPSPDLLKVYRGDGANEATQTGAAFRDYVLKDLANYRRAVTRGNLKMD